NIRPGDRFRPLGMKGSKKVGDYLTDKKVAMVYRDEVPVLCDGKGIIWLVGYEIADRVKVRRATRRILKVEYIVRKQSPAGQV
ncbi:MAG: tRNA lysidine(34) synthetase TilS, partial [Candidatus Zixiibacteriota bacterium]